MMIRGSQDESGAEDVEDAQPGSLCPQERFDPTVKDSRFLAAGRQLILSSFPSDVSVFPLNYDNCHLMNARNEALCRRATGYVGKFVGGGGCPSRAS